jgi:hypothetical protein
VNIKNQFDKVNEKLDKLEKLVKALSYPAEPLELFKVNKPDEEVKGSGPRKNKSTHKSSE